MENLPQAHHIARKVETQMKAMVAPGSIFEELGLNYIGPIDGHDINELTKVVGNLKDFEGPQFLHVITKKGAGLDPAEADRIGFHAIGKIKPLDSIHSILLVSLIISPASEIISASLILFTLTLIITTLIYLLGKPKRACP